MYVDDIIVTGPSPTDIQDFISQLGARFSLKDLGDLTYFLGVEVQCHPKGLFLSQRKYIGDILSRAGMAGAKPVPTPMVTHPPLTKYDGTPLKNPT